MTIKLKDIAKAAGVSEATASLALNDNELVKNETREKVKRIARELGYSPNAMARGLARKRSGTIGLIVPDIESAYYGKLVRCIDESVREAGYSLILAISNDRPEVEKKIIENFISERVEGVIIAPVNQYNSDTGYISSLRDHRIPCVFVSACYPQLDMSYVMVDLEEGSYRLIKYLLELGHEHIVFLCGNRNVITTSCRVKGYIRAFEEKGLNFDESYFIECSRLNYEQACEVTQRILKLKKPIDAITTINDMMALGVINTIIENHIRVPQDISVTGYDNVIFSTISPVPITTVNQDLEKMSWNAAGVLINHIKNPVYNKEQIILKPDLIIRESTNLKQR